MMKKVILLTIALLLIPAFVLAAPGHNASQYCKENDDYGVSHGKCVSTVEACIPPGTAYPDAVCICKFLKATDPTGYEEFFGSLGLGQCIQYIRLAP